MAAQSHSGLSVLGCELELACDAARAAGEVAMQYYGSATATLKEGGSPVTQADHAADEVIAGMLRQAFPEDSVLSEESADSMERLAANRVWVVDPLDGTREFLAQNGEFAVMIGLAVQGRPVLGVVYQPAVDRLFYAAEGGGSFLRENGRTRVLRCRPPSGPLRLVGSRSHPDRLLLEMQAALGIRDVRPSGSVGVKCGLIALGERDLYIHPVPYLREWDTCAPEVILREAGGAVCDCRGGALQYNKADTRQPDGIVACEAGQLAGVLNAVSSIYSGASAAS